MAEIVRLPQHRIRRQNVFFTRFELNQLLSLYSRHVVSGEWRDYAIDLRPGEAVFSVFRHTAERPLFTITKTMTQGQIGKGRPVYRVSRGREILKRSERLADALTAFARHLHLVTGVR